MSHIFVSYSHKDKNHLDKVLDWLSSANFVEQEIWHDHHIEGGSNWRDEIADALDEAFAVLVITTKNSVQSLYCTYEWAYAMGQGIPIFPLIFDDVSMTDVPAPLASKQAINCTQIIPDDLKDRVRRYRSVRPEIAAINRMVYETIYDTHRRFFILSWLGEGLARVLDDDIHRMVLSYFIEEASEAHQSLEKLMIDNTSALSGKQYRLCWKVMDFLREFSQLHHKYENYMLDKLAPQFESDWLPAFKYFESDNWWYKTKGQYFEYDLDNEHNRLEILAEITRVFPHFYAHDAGFLIDSKISILKRKM